MIVRRCATTERPVFHKIHVPCCRTKRAALRRQHTGSDMEIRLVAPEQWVAVKMRHRVAVDSKAKVAFLRIPDTTQPCARGPLSRLLTIAPSSATYCRRTTELV